MHGLEVPHGIPATHAAMRRLSAPRVLKFFYNPENPEPFTVLLPGPVKRLLSFLILVAANPQLYLI